MKLRRKYSKFQVPDGDCIAYFGKFVIRVFNVNSDTHQIEFNLVDVPAEVQDAVKVWARHHKYAGLTLTEYLNTLFVESDYTS
jgi:hypothetical protein